MSDLAALRAPAAADPAGDARFRDALSRLAGGVAVAACLDAGAPRGLLVSSLTSLSAEPRRVLFCVRKSARAYAPLSRADRCSLSVLAEHDRVEAERFSRADRAAERFIADGWRIRPDAPPFYEPALVSLAGPVSGRIDAGSHGIFILDVEAVESRAARPLIYFDRAFAGLAWSA